MTHRIEKDGYTRIVHDDSVHWVLDHKPNLITYFVARFPFVPDYHLCDLVEDYYNPVALMSHVCERPLQQFKTLAQALAVLRVIEGSQS